MLKTINIMVASLRSSNVNFTYDKNGRLNFFFFCFLLDRQEEFKPEMDTLHTIQHDFDDCTEFGNEKSNPSVFNRTTITRQSIIRQYNIFRFIILDQFLQFSNKIESSNKCVYNTHTHTHLYLAGFRIQYNSDSIKRI